MPHGQTEIQFEAKQTEAKTFYFYLLIAVKSTAPPMQQQQTERSHHEEERALGTSNESESKGEYRETSRRGIPLK